MATQQWQASYVRDASGSPCGGYGHPQSGGVEHVRHLSLLLPVSGKVSYNSEGLNIVRVFSCFNFYYLGYYTYKIISGLYIGFVIHYQHFKAIW